jgi:hypothetical protein
MLMTNAIIEKLRTHLAGPVDTECKVVYLLCEIRKLLEPYKHEPSWFTLRLHCHWALHVNLVFASTTLPFLRKIDTYVSNVWDKPSATIVTDPEGNVIRCEIRDKDPVFEDFGYLGTFRKELSEFLGAHGLPTALCDDDTCWSQFLTAYAGVLEDGSLECKATRRRLDSARTRDDELVLVERVTFTKGRRLENALLPFDIRWSIFLKDGRTLEVEVGASRNLKGTWWTRREHPKAMLHQLDGPEFRSTNRP